MRCLNLLLVLGALSVWSASSAACAAERPRAEAGSSAEAEIPWHDDYGQAYAKAKAEKKLLVVLFESAEERFEPDPETVAALAGTVGVRLRVEDSARLLRHTAFRNMHNAAGVGVADLKNEGPTHGRLVGALPATYWTQAGVRALVALAEGQSAMPQLTWHLDYGAARAEAVAERRMLLVAIDGEEEAYVPRPEAIPALCSYVLCRQTTESTYESQGQERRLLDHAEFKELRGQPGLVICDFQHVGQPYYGTVVSVMPYRYLGPNPGNRVFSEAEREQKLLTLEPNTLTRRTLVWAIRVSTGHGPNQRLRSADGRPCDRLMLGARRNSVLQCRSGVGHFAGGLTGPEIASPGPGRDIVDGALNMVRIWKSSPPHYSVMARYHPRFGYDMHPSSSKHWYGTGRF
jgi:hypothetical protein